MTVVDGVIKGRRIELAHATDLPDGAQVRLHIEMRGDMLEPKQQALEKLFGSCAEDPTFLKSVQEIEMNRGVTAPRKIDFDVAS